MRFCSRRLRCEVEKVVQEGPRVRGSKSQSGPLLSIKKFGRENLGRLPAPKSPQPKSRLRLPLTPKPVLAQTIRIMGRELQKKKRRSGRQPVRPKKTTKVLNPRGNNIIAQNW